MSDFKIGDKVKITAVTKDYRGSLKVGDLAIIEEFQGSIKKYAGMVDDDVSICFWHSVDCFELAPKEVETVTHEGKVYQIGQEYLFSNAGNAWFYAALDDVISKTANPFKTKYQNFFSIKEVPASKNLGTITPAPIELVNGNAYMFDYGCIGNRVGVYHKETDRFYFAMAHVTVSACTNIRLMTVGSK